MACNMVITMEETGKQDTELGQECKEIKVYYVISS